MNLLSLEQALRCNAEKALFGQTSVVYGRGLATFLPFLSEGGKKCNDTEGMAKVIAKVIVKVMSTN